MTSSRPSMADLHVHIPVSGEDQTVAAAVGEPSKASSCSWSWWPFHGVVLVMETGSEREKRRGWVNQIKSR